MNRLDAELGRLYGVAPSTGAVPGSPSPMLISASGTVRALVLELAQPPSWEVLSRVWHGVQADLHLPAPAIAVSGLDALQLWFALAEPVPVARAHAFLECLRLQYLADVEARRVRLLPAADPSCAGQHVHARPVPSLQAQTGNWSAFLAVDLVPIFADTPWLDIPPSEDGQATLLQGLGVIELAAFEAVLARRTAPTAAPVADMAGTGAGAAQGRADAEPAAIGTDPQTFLMHVMNDGSVPLALRIEAAKALLLHGTPRDKPGRG